VLNSDFREWRADERAGTWCTTTPSSIIALFEETGNANIVAEWQNWGKKLRLPLYIKAGDGALLPDPQQVDGVLVGNQTQRRKLTAEANRRPAFLNRRKPGDGSTL